MHRDGESQGRNEWLNEWHSFLPLCFAACAFCCTSVCHSGRRCPIRTAERDSKGAGAGVGKTWQDSDRNWGALEFHKAFSMKIIKMRRAFKIKRHGNLIVSKKKGGVATPPHPLLRPLQLPVCTITNGLQLHWGDKWVFQQVKEEEEEREKSMRKRELRANKIHSGSCNMQVPQECRRRETEREWEGKRDVNKTTTSTW